MCNIPPASAFVPDATGATNNAATLLAILLPFKRLYGDDGFMQDEILDDKDKHFQCYQDLAALKVQPRIYVNFGHFTLADYVDPIPKKRGFFSLKCEKAIQDILDPFNTYSAPRPRDFCIEDPDYSISKSMFNMFGGPGPFTVLKKRSEKKEDVDTLWESAWRRDPGGNWFEALLVWTPAVAACYYTDNFEFLEESFEPNPDNLKILDDNKIYFSEIKRDLYREVVRMNALLNIISNFGETGSLHPFYNKLLSRVRAEIGGHTDDIEPKPGYNKALSARRAELVMKHVCDNAASVLQYPPSVTKLADAISDRLAWGAYAASECATKSPTQDRSCRKITVRLTLAPK
jgi:hypothetical protein